MAVVVPWAKRSGARAPTARAAATTASSWRALVGTLAVVTRPSSTSTASVNVPPTSIPSIATRVLCRVRGYAAAMPYESVEDLPEEQVDQYSEHGKRAFLEAFNSALETYDGDESRAFAVAHTAAKRADEKD